VVGRKGSFGEVNFSPVPCWPIDTTFFIDKSASNADLKWLSYRLKDLDLTQLNKAAAVPGLNREDAYRRRLLLPPLVEQRRIAAILDAAEALREKRRQSLAKLDTLTKAIFLEMFGDPASKGWGMTNIAG
jgi:type I restriction enzyme S subunit